MVGEGNNNLKEENKGDEKNEEYGDRKQENEQGGTYEEGKKSDNQFIRENDKLWQEIKTLKTLPRTGNDYFMVKLFLVDFIIFISFIFHIYHRKDMNKSRSLNTFKVLHF